MNRTFVKAFVAALVSVFFVLTAFAGANDPVVQKREKRQQKRIEQGEKSGQLTPQEERKLEKEQAKIQRDEARMKSDGKLTAKERRKLRREQNRASRHIYKEKHDAQKAD